MSPDLGPNCLQRLSVDYKSTLARKELKGFYFVSNYHGI